MAPEDERLSRHSEDEPPLLYGLRFRWKGFRGFLDTSWFDVEPLTILIGPNNSGKTSAIAPLLLLKQTWGLVDAEPALLATGPLIEAGTFLDLVHNHDRRRQVSFSMHFHVHERTRENLATRLTSFPPSGCELVFQEAASQIVLASYRAFDSLLRTLISRKRQRNGNYSLGGVNALISDLAKRPSANTDGVLRAQIRRSRPTNFLFRGTDPWSVAVREIQGNDIEVSEYSSRYLSAVDLVAAGVTSTLHRIKFIGPLRRRPQRLYQTSGSPPREVGPEGEFAPEMFFRGSRREQRAVERWLKRFGLLEGLDANAITDTAFFLCTRSESSRDTNFADTGFGLSQVLPLVVQGIFGEPGEILLAEQPEIHLNPRMQTTLADLFVSLTQAGKGVIVETHSEHFLLRTRRLIAEGAIHHDDVALYFVEQTEEGSSMRRIPIEPDGHIDRDVWPAGFFEDALHESLGLAMEQQKNRVDAG